MKQNTKMEGYISVKIYDTEMFHIFVRKNATSRLVWEYLNLLLFKIRNQYCASTSALDTTNLALLLKLFSLSTVSSRFLFPDI